jgi:precorrin-2 dehydrogenase/sirohydrochlorin ferrochelatase
MRYYPIALNVGDKSALVVGGGSVAERKVQALLAAGATVRVVAPTATPLLKELVQRKKITWTCRNVHAGDAKGVDIVVAATDDEDTNTTVSRWAEKQGAWVNVVDRPGLSDFISPAVVRNGDSIIAVYTNGKDPVLSRDVKNFLKERWDDFLSYRSRL